MNRIKSLTPGVNIHAPARAEGESVVQYRARRAMHRAAVAKMTRPPIQESAKTAKDSARFFLGQRTNPAKNRRRAQIKAAGGIRQFKKLRAHLRVIREAAIAGHASH